MPRAPATGGTWDNADFLMDFALALYQVSNNAGALTAQSKAAIVQYLGTRGYGMTWEAMRSHRPLITIDLHFIYFHQHLNISRPESPNMPPKRVTMKWDEDVHRDILIGVFTHVTLSAQDWEILMESLRGMGHTFTESALRYGLCVSLELESAA